MTEDEIIAAWQADLASKDFTPTHMILVNDRVFDLAPDLSAAERIAMSIVEASDQANAEIGNSPTKSVAVVEIEHQWKINSDGELERVK